VEEGRVEAEESPLRRAPHTARAVTAAEWDRPYSREQGAFPAPWVRDAKFWPAVARSATPGDQPLRVCPAVGTSLSSAVASSAGPLAGRTLRAFVPVAPYRPVHAPGPLPSRRSAARALASLLTPPSRCCDSPRAPALVALVSRLPGASPPRHRLARPSGFTSAGS
jgi:hypothetical protein